MLLPVGRSRATTPPRGSSRSSPTRERRRQRGQGGTIKTIPFFQVSVLQPSFFKHFEFRDRVKKISAFLYVGHFPEKKYAFDYLTILIFPPGFSFTAATTLRRAPPSPRASATAPGTWSCSAGPGRRTWAPWRRAAAFTARRAATARAARSSSSSGSGSSPRAPRPETWRRRCSTSSA